MKRFSSPYAASSVLLGVLVPLGIATSVTAQTIPAVATTVGADQSFSLPASVEAALSYPNSSQRFFEEGNTRLEQEIQRFLTVDEQPKPVLTVQPEVLKQFENE